ncbi:MAG TPA: hypothetical protein VGO84_11235 [Burkholderiales bacterium]|jgi:hypothetical protein|nr:hypothetical protein [Burkholderiales bacterium]
MRQANIALRAVTHDSDDHAHLSAYNAAFCELGLRFRWDSNTLSSLASTGGGEQARILAYIETHHAHLLRAYEAAFLCGLIFEKKTAYYVKACENRAAQAAPIAAANAAAETRAIDERSAMLSFA